jgi:hypothetical protein
MHTRNLISPGSSPPVRATLTSLISKIRGVFFGLTGILLTACGSIVTSTTSSQPTTGTESPVPLRDSVAYYLPTGLIKVDGTWDDKKGWTVVVSTDVHADSTQRYMLSLNAKYPFYDHNAVLTVNEKGLLKTVTGSAADHTIDSVASLVAAAGSALSFAASLGMPVAAEARALEEDHSPFHVTLDPFRGKTSATVSGFTISVVDQVAPLMKDTKDANKSSQSAFQGVVTRLLMPFTVVIAQKGGDDNHTQTATVLLPDLRQAYVLGVPRAPIVTNKTTIQLLDGSLISYDVERPSVVYGFINIPKNILAALAPIPGNARQQQVANIEATKTILADEAAIKKLRGE